MAGSWQPGNGDDAMGRSSASVANLTIASRKSSYLQHYFAVAILNPINILSCRADSEGFNYSSLSKLCPIYHKIGHHFCYAWVKREVL